jgi:hypothetical protein
MTIFDKNLSLVTNMSQLFNRSVCSEVEELQETEILAKTASIPLQMRNMYFLSRVCVKSEKRDVEKKTLKEWGKQQKQPEE